MGTPENKNPMPAINPLENLAAALPNPLKTLQEKAQEVARPLDDFKKTVETQMEQQAKTAGVALNYEKLRSNANPSDLGEVLKQLAKAFHGVIDKIAALFAPLGMKKEEIEATLAEPEKTAPDSQEPAREDAAIEPGKILHGKNLERAWHAKNTIDQKPDWKTAIHASSLAHNIPEATIAAIIEMESGFNPKAKNKLSSALGFGQLTDDTFFGKNGKGGYVEYAKAHGNPNPDRENPLDGIDMTAWNARRLITAVAAMRPPEKYLLQRDDAENIALAHMLGAAGYMAYRKFADSATPQEREENLKALRALYKADVGGKPPWEGKAFTAARVAEVAFAYERIKDGPPEKEVRERPDLEFAPIAAGARVTSGFGMREDPITHEHGAFHNGVDLAAPEGTPVLAVRRARVKRVGVEEASGNLIALELDNGFVAKYCHLQKPPNRNGAPLKAGDEIAAGERIGEVGQTGKRVTGPHLHFMLQYNDRLIDPHSAVLAAVEKQKTSTAQA